MRPSQTTDTDHTTTSSRRTFLGAMTGAAVAAGTGGFAPTAEARPDGDADPKATTPTPRAQAALKLRQDAAKAQLNLGQATHVSNGDEARYASKIGSYSKGLPHNSLGEVNVSAYNTLLSALASATGPAFEAITMGGTARLTNPQAGLAFSLEGADSQALTQKPAPAFASAEEAGEMAENYWMADCRDVPFSQYDNDPFANGAAFDLSRMSDFHGPKSGGNVTTQTLFRNGVSGDLIGPYISQFMWLPTPFGPESVDRRMRTTAEGSDFMTNYAEWLSIQRGAAPAGTAQFDPTRRYIRNGRDLGEWVHNDVLFQAYFNALLILFSLHAPLDQNNPYRTSRTQTAFGTFGPPYFASTLCAVAREALKEVWYQKWFVHRRLRPEAFAGRVQNHITHAATYPLHDDIVHSFAVAEMNRRNSNALLPMAYPEGCPTHPAYGAGHAAVAGACVTVLKAFFDESFVIPNPVQASDDGLSLLPFTGPPLTVGNELNKVAANIAMGRNFAGVHWRSDATESLKLGEDVAIRYLTDEKPCFNETFSGFSITKFDGTQITI
jgi:hypothetical protein